MQPSQLTPEERLDAFTDLLATAFNGCGSNGSGTAASGRRTRRGARTPRAAKMNDFRQFIEDVRERASIVDVIGADVELREAGSTLKGLSPFTSEKHPSFVVWLETRT